MAEKKEVKKEIKAETQEEHIARVKARKKSK